METDIGSAPDATKPPVGIQSVATIVTGEFLELADRFRVTPEMLLSFAAREFVDSQPKALNVLSASPLDEQDCESCPLLKRCGSAIRRAREKLVCFEKLPVALAVIAAVIGLLIVPQQNATVTTAPSITAPPPLHEPVTLPYSQDTYLKPKMRAKFAKKKKRRKHAGRDTERNPLVVVWNDIKRAGYRNARR